MAATFHITPGPKDVLKRADAGVRWCFNCRKKLPHTDELLHDAPFIDAEGVTHFSYYEPVWVRRCSGCGRDCTRFPGTGLD